MSRMLHALFLLSVAVATATAGTTSSRPTLTLEGARQVIAAAEAEAMRDNKGGAIAIVDDGGNLVALARLEGTFAAASSIAVGKARTAALFQRSTAVFENVIRDGRTSMVALPDFTPLQGGIPITVGGQIVGAVGISGAASAARDEEIAKVASVVLEITTASK